MHGLKISSRRLDNPMSETPENQTPESEPKATDEAVETAETLNAEPAAQGEAAEAAPNPEAVVAVLKAEVSDLRDRLLRAAAEMENTRKRAERDKQDATRYAAANFARDMLQVSDNLRRAIQTLKEDERAGAADSVKAMVEGVEMTERQLLSIFERHGIREITPQPGERFDANLHEAMFEVPGTEHPAGTVVHVLEGGYMIGDRLLRAARVGVAKTEGAEKGANIDTTV
jgi:molecular chaperone GrpE